MSTRRNLLTAAMASVMLPGAVVASVRPSGAPADAELIAVCAEFDACERQTNIIHGTGSECVVDDDEARVVSAPFFDRMSVLLDRMDELRATTPAGNQARAHSLAQHGGHFQYDFGCQTTMVGRLLTYLLRDSAALGGSSSSIVRAVVTSDADLVEKCAPPSWQARLWCCVLLATDQPLNFAKIRDFRSGNLKTQSSFRP